MTEHTTPADSQEFWAYYEAHAAPRLDLREHTFRKVFSYLDTLPAPITIVETGCVRVADNWGGDGQSTILFDKYVTSRGHGSKVYSVDLNSDNVTTCRSLVSANVEVTVADSVAYLDTLTRQLLERRTRVSLFYLDSFDLDLTYWFPSACHHLKELVAAWRSIDKQTLVVVDDCPLSAHLVINKEGKLVSAMQPIVGGKGRLVAEFAQQVGLKPLFASYQAGWVGF
jgi:hypothetical protein